MDFNRSLHRQWIVSLFGTPGIGWHAIDKAFKLKLWTRTSWTIEELLKGGFPRGQAETLSTFCASKAWRSDDVEAGAEAAGAVLLTPLDAQYPFMLRESPQPPWVLYAKGRIELLQRPAVAIVGTRVPTAYGRHMAAEFAQKLSEGGMTVVSGLARGVDSIAHRAALKGAGATIAVLPTPIDLCYPSENHTLYSAIQEQGLLISETPPGTKLHPGQFPKRNRIIAALARATVVVEGASRSGSLITATQAFEMDREVFALPGPITSPKSEGPNELIRSCMARLMTSVDEIYSELPWLAGDVAQWQRSNNGDFPLKAAAEDEVKLNPDERKLIHFLRDRPLSINELHELSAIPFGHLNVLLLNLCIKRKIELQPGSIYIAL